MAVYVGVSFHIKRRQVLKQKSKNQFLLKKMKNSKNVQEPQRYKTSDGSFIKLVIRESIDA